MEHRKTYLMSSDLDYALMISPAAGPTYAKRMGWATVDVDTLTRGKEPASLREATGEGAVIVDNRITERECHALVEHLNCDTETPFLFRVIDPYYEWCRDHWYYRMLFAVAERPNVGFITPYTPAELVAELGQASGRDRLLVVPYPYPEDIEQPLDDDRRPDIIFSGNQHRRVYPFRFAFGQLSTWWPPVRLRVDGLEHPGYPDIGHEQRHEIVGALYVARLAQYMYMFVSPSRCRLEFLKYGECAAAGCLPIGALPNGLPQEAAVAFVELDFRSAFRLERSIRRSLQMPSNEARVRASAYRETMKVERSAKVLNELVDEFLSGSTLA